MTRTDDRNKAIKLRKEGASYGQIKASLNVSKSTLSVWLRNYPLPEARLKELVKDKYIRIERFRNTMALRREERLKLQYDRAKKEIGVLSKRDIYIAGLFLYWAEGSKTAKGSVVLTNTNPDMLIFFINWLDSIGVSKDKLKMNVHLYSDMDINKELQFWSKTLGVQLKQFRKPYIKNSRLVDRTYRTGFNHGTCSVIYENKETLDYVLSGLNIIMNT